MSSDACRTYWQKLRFCHVGISSSTHHDSPGGVTNPLGNSSRRFHESTFESAAVFASASGSARNLSAHTGASAATTARSERSFAIFSAVLPRDQPPQLKPTTIVATAASGCTLTQPYVWIGRTLP